MPEALVVIFSAESDDFVSFIPSVYMGNLAGTTTFARRGFVSQEVVLESIDDLVLQLVDVLDLPISRIVFEHRHDLVIDFLTIDHAKAANGDGFQQQIAVKNGAVGQHTNIKWIAIT